MTDLSTPGEVDAEVDSTSTGHAIGKAGTGAWVVDGVDIAGIYTSLDETVLNAFNFNSTDSSGLDAVIDPGEAYVSGWLCRDTQTTVTLPADSTTTVYVGYDASAILGDGEAPADSANIIVGEAADFASEDPRTAIWEFDTNADNITAATSLRQLRKPIEYDPEGGLTVTDNTAFGSGIDIDTNNSHIDLIESDTGDQWRFEAQNGNWQVTEVGVDTHLRIDPSDGGRVEHPNGGAFGDTLTANAGIDSNGNVDIDGRIDVHDTSAQIRIHETDTDAQWNTAVSSGNLNLNESGGSGLLRLIAGGNVEVPNGTITNERGVNMVTGDPDQGHIFNGSSAPSDSLGRDGDLFVEY